MNLGFEGATVVVAGGTTGMGRAAPTASPPTALASRYSLARARTSTPRPPN